LRRQLTLLAPVCAGLEDRLAEYVAADPSEPETVVTDTLDCLQWLRGRYSWTPRQLDHWLCQQAICLLAQRMETCGRKYRQFWLDRRQSLACGGAMDGRLQPSQPLWIAVNPLRRWVSLATPALIRGVARPPANVMLYAVEREIRAAAFGLEGLALFNSLVDHEPCTLGEWAIEVTLAGHELLHDFCRDLAALSLVMLGPSAAGAAPLGRV